MVDPTKSFRGKRGNKNDKNENNGKPTQALYIEVVKGSAAPILKSISRMYSKTLCNYPDNENMRFIPSPTYIQNSYIHDRYSELISRQNWFLMYTKNMTSFELNDLDIKASQLPKTLRECLMEMTNKQNKPLFLTVDEGWNGGIVFTFPSQFEDDARDRIGDLGPYLHYKAGDMILIKHFNPGAAARALEAPWDPKLGRAVSTLQNEVEEILKDCDDEEWMKNKEIKKHIVVDSPVDDEYIIKPGLFNHPPDDDRSLNTFGNHSALVETTTSTLSITSTPRPVVQQDKRNINKDIDLEELTVDDNATMSSITSRLTCLEDSFKDVERLSGTIESLVKILQQAEGTPGFANLHPSFDKTPDPREGEGGMP